MSGCERNDAHDPLAALNLGSVPAGGEMTP
ncbi:hypothetical protein PS880_05073 [Pseudomonas fluorescens]|uniref:Uncharacterized protein n=1 Tax=Pseudomonas fluorescens TaxID=294 RepID=A0A5E7P6N3_PSEFL|nr:hypothetical protein PS880_05073 [Pseudomonas fluorescens]